MMWVVFGLSPFLFAALAGCGGGAGQPGAGEIKVVNFQAGAKGRGQGNITIEFSGMAVDRTQVGQAPPAPPVEFAPPIEGRFQWVAPDTLRFYPKETLPGGLRYEARVKDAAVAIPGLKLVGEKTFVFETEHFAIKDALVNISYTDFKRKLAKVIVDLTFNYPVAPKTLSESLELDLQDEGRLAYAVTQTEPAAAMQLTTDPLPMVDRSRNLTLAFPKGLPAVAGNTGLAAGATLTLKVEGRKTLKVEEVMPEQQGDLFAIVVRFSSYIQLEAAKPYLSVSPAIDYRLGDAWRGAAIVAEFKPGQSYSVTVKKGFIADDGAVLEEDLTREVLIPDYEPTVKFASPGYYLPREGAGAVGVETINVSSLRVSVAKIFPNNLVFFLNSSLARGSYYDSYYGDDYYYGGYADLDALGQTIGKEEELSVTSRQNEKAATPIDLKRYFAGGGRHKGVFLVTAVDPQSERRDQKWVLATDIGLVVKAAPDALWVFANSLKTLDPVAGATVSLMSLNNQELAVVRSDEKGQARLPNLAALKKNFEPYAIVVQKGEDMTFLRLSDSVVPSGDFDVGGLAAPEAFQYRTWIYADRGVYRPDDTAHLVAVVRTAELGLPPSMPVKLVVRGPDQRIFKTFQAALPAHGALEFALEVPAWAMTGRWRAELLMATEAALGETTFLVEDFVPDRINVKLTADKPAYRAGETAALTVKGTLLFGPPAAGRRVEATARLAASRFEPASYGTYSFYDDAATFETTTIELGEAALGEDGQAGFSLALPAEVRPPSSLAAIVSATVHDEGGRAVSSQLSLPVHPYPFYVGVKKEAEGYAEPGKPAAFSLVALDADGRVLSGKAVTVELYRVIWHTALQRDNRGFYRYVSERKEERVETTEATTGDKPVSVSLTPKEFGAWRVVATAKDGGHKAAVSFYASGWGYAPWAMSMPDRLQIDLDKKAYAPGETAQAIVRAPFAGKLILTVERAGVMATKIVSMDGNTATVPLAVEADWAPNVYVSATLIRSVESLEPYAPARAFGVYPLFVDHSRHKLAVTLDAPAEMRPNRPLTVRLSVGGGSGSAWATIAAVDEGILQLTGFASPDPLKFFFARQRLAVATHDLYSFLLPELKGAKRKKGEGGDAMEEARQKNLNPVAIKRVKPVSLWSGLVQLDAQGRGEATFSVPEFNGSLRIMAVAFDRDRFAGAQTATTVADAIVLSPTAPRALAPGDAFALPVSVYNKTGREGSFEIKATTTGPVAVRNGAQRVSLKDGAEAVVVFEAEVKPEAGAATVTVEASGNGATTKSTADVVVRPPNPLVIDAGSGRVPAGEKATLKLPGGHLAGTARLRLAVSALPAAQFGASLQYLLTYPYGCVEQTTSAAFPLLYFKDLARQAEPRLFADKSADYYVNRAIEKLEAMQLTNGGFAYWPGGGEDYPWATLWAGHFLIEAEKAGFVVSQRTSAGLRARLKSLVAEGVADAASPEGRRNLERRAYALYLLALAGAPDVGAMTYLKDNLLDRLGDYPRLLLAAAFHHAGNARAAKALLPAAIAPSSAKRESGGNFNSPERGTALILATLAEVEPQNPAVAVLTQKLLDTVKIDRHGTTQDHAVALLALGKIYRREPEARFTGKLSKGLMSTVAEFDEKGTTLDDASLAGENLTIAIEGTGAAYYFWQVEGVPTKGGVKEHDIDLAVRRRYLDKNGQELGAEAFKQGELVVAEITLTASEALENVVVTDLLPGGLEIENPRLASREAFEWESEDESSTRLYPSYMDLRDDRLVLFASLAENQKAVFRYALRAVTAGRFALPPIKAEAMYDPVKNSLASSGAIVVRPLAP